MNKKLTIALLHVITGTTSAQTSVYHPFPESDAMWCAYNAHNDGPCLSETRASYEMNGQATINNVVYSRLRVAQTYFDYCTSFSSQDTGSLYIRQDTSLRKVWQCVPGNEETILYDFDLQVGDTLNEREFWGGSFQAPDYWIVTSIDSILIDGNYRKQFHYAPTFAPFCYSAMIEGIGADHGLIFLPRNCFEYTATLSKFYQDGNLLFGDATPFAAACPDHSSGVPDRRAKSTVSISPNPFHSTTQLTVEPEPEHAELRIYNAQGEQMRRQTLTSRVTSIDREGWANGIYFFQVFGGNGKVGGGSFVIE